MRQYIDNGVANLKGFLTKKGRLIVLLSAIWMMTLIVGCSTQKESIETGNSIETAGTSTSEAKTTLTIMAAASLTEMFTEVESFYESKHSNVDLVFSFAGSQSLATQISEGIAADVFASANTNYMTNLIDEGLVDGADVSIFAKNKLALIVNTNVTSIETYADLAKGDYKIVVADETVPVGRYTLTFLEQVEANLPGFTQAFNGQIVSRETNVKLVASKVELGEADCGIVYLTDLTSSNQDLLKIVEIPDDLNVIASYPIAKIKNSVNAALSQEFVDFILSDQGKAVLGDFGFTVE